MFTTESIRNNSTCRGATDATIEAATGDWLRYAKDRDGGRQARQARVQAAQALGDQYVQMQMQ